jgi:hypothetical protein
MHFADWKIMTEKCCHLEKYSFTTLDKHVRKEIAKKIFNSLERVEDKNKSSNQLEQKKVGLYFCHLSLF